MQFLSFFDVSFEHICEHLELDSFLFFIEIYSFTSLLLFGSLALHLCMLLAHITCVIYLCILHVYVFPMLK